MFESPEQPANSARFTFLDSAAREFYPDWERLASELVATLRSQAGRNPYDRDLQDLIGDEGVYYEMYCFDLDGVIVNPSVTGSNEFSPEARGLLRLVLESWRWE